MSLPGKKTPRERALELRDHYRTALFDDVVPWWMEHSIDREHGGYYSLLERDGRPWATDKYMWMNGRQLWLLSHLYNTQRQDPDWLEAARLGAEFIVQHAFRDDGKMHFRLTREGQSVLLLYCRWQGGGLGTVLLEQIAGKHESEHPGKEGVDVREAEENAFLAARCLFGGELEPLRREEALGQTLDRDADHHHEGDRMDLDPEDVDIAFEPARGCHGHR